METGIDRKQVRTKPGIHVHYYTSQHPKVYTIEQHNVHGSLHAEQLCIQLFTDATFRFDEKELVDAGSEPATIYPGSLHLFQLWNCETRQYMAPNDEIVLADASSTKEFVLRIRFHYPPSLEKQNFNDVWETGAFYYYFVQCRHDFIHDILHDVYHSHVKEDLCIGLALVDMARLAFEKYYDLKQLKEKFEYHAFLPRHVAKKTKGLIVKRHLTKSSNNALEVTHDSFKCIGKNPHRNSIVSYLKQLLPSVPEYASEEFTVNVLEGNRKEQRKLVVHPYGQKFPGIFFDLGKNSLDVVGNISSLTAIEITEVFVLLHFTDSRAQPLEFVDVSQARSFVAMLDGYYRLMIDYHYSLSDQICSPIVKRWNGLKCYGPLSKDYLKVIWRRTAATATVGEGHFLLKQRSSSFTDFVMVVHKMGKNYPAIPILYNASDNSYSCDESVLSRLFQSHHREPKFSSVRELISYYRSGNYPHLKLTNQLSPKPREEIPLMVCRNRNTPKLEQAGPASIDLHSITTPVLLSFYDVNFGSAVHGSHIFDLIEGTYGREKVLIRQVKPAINDMEKLTLFFQRDVQKTMKWRHDGVVRLYGLCLSPFYVMSQRMMEGRLDHMLKRRSSSFHPYHCIQATLQLTHALVYLDSHAFTHGTIRCKNIFVSSFDSHGDIEVKLAADMTSAYMCSLPLTDRLNFERLPWIALERWTDLKKESTESDVYSFGMTVWEIFSNGERPLASYHSVDQLKIFIESGRAIPVPVTIERLKNTHPNKQESVVNGVFNKVIVENINSDSSKRMTPLGILREMIFLNCKFSPTAYDPVNPVVQSVSVEQINAATSSSGSSGSSSSGYLYRHIEGAHTPAHGISERSAAHGISERSAAHGISDRLPPNIPLPIPPTAPAQPHIVCSADLTGIDDDKNIIGRGHYGIVYLCTLKQEKAQPGIKCAVKKLKDRSDNSEAHEKAMKEFERELKLMVQLTHDNIVKMYGECFYTFSDGEECRLIVMEYVKCGNLFSFVRSKRQKLPQEERHQLYRRFCSDIAEGMKFLHSLNEGIIHRDLAARNVLITEPPHVAKITDFGLARNLGDKDYYRCGAGSVLPALWCAPESLNFNKFTKASDVWSYAIVLWEMFSDGEKVDIILEKAKTKDKQSLIDMQTLIDVLHSNCRLPKLPNMSAELYNLMMRCWEWEPDRRPTFQSICTLLQTII